MDTQKIVENIQRICKERGTNPTVAGEKSGAGKSLVTQLKTRGIMPSVEKMQLLAQYLGVTTSELLGEEIPDLAALQAVFKKFYRVDGELPPDASPEAREAFRRLQAMEDLPGIVNEINPEDQWEFLRLGKQALDAKARREAAEKKPTPVDGDGPRAEAHRLVDQIPPDRLAEAVRYIKFITATSDME